MLLFISIYASSSSGFLAIYPYLIGCVLFIFQMQTHCISVVTAKKCARAKGLVAKFTCFTCICDPMPTDKSASAPSDEQHESNTKVVYLPNRACKIYHLNLLFRILCYIKRGFNQQTSTTNPKRILAGEREMKRKKNNNERTTNQCLNKNQSQHRYGRPRVHHPLDDYLC